MSVDSSTLIEASSWRALLRKGRLLQLMLLCLGVWLNAADTLVTATIMPSIVRDIGGYAYFAWPVAVYLLGAIVAGASAGRLSEIAGLRPALIGASLVYAAGCVVGALSSSIEVFLLGRLLQGVGAGWVGGLVYVVVNMAFPKGLWTRVLAVISGVWGVAMLLGPAFGGFFAELGQWRMAYWVFAGQAVFFAFAALALVPKGKPVAPESKFPLARLALLGAAILLIADAGTHGGLGLSATLLGCGLALLAVFLRIDARSTHSLLPRQLAAIGAVSGAGYRMMFFANASTIGFSVYGAALMQSLYSLSPLEAGYVISAQAAAWTISAVIVAGVNERWHGLFIRTGSSSILLGLIALAFAFPSGHISYVVAAALVMGSGFGQCWAFTTHRIFASLPPQGAASGSSAVLAVQLVGNAVGAAIAGAAANLLGMTDGLTMADAMRIGHWLFLITAPIALAAWVSAQFVARMTADAQPKTRNAA